MTGSRRGLHPSVVLFLCLFAAQAALLVLSPILPQVAAEFDVSNAAAAQLRSVSGATAGTFALYLAARGDRYRLVPLLRTGLFLLAGGSTVSATAPGFALLLTAQVVIGMGLAMVLSGGLAASEAWATGGDGSRLLSWALVGQPVAWVVGQPVAGAVAGVDWRWAWVAVPLAASMVALGALAGRSARGAGLADCNPAGMWRRPGIRAWAVGELAAFSGWAGLLVYAGAFFIETYGTSVATTGVILGVVAASYLPGNFLARPLLDRSATRVLVVSAAGLAIWVALFGGFRPGVVFSTVALSILAFLAGGRTIAGAATGLALSGGRRLAAMSVRTAVLQFGYLLGTALGGLVLPVWGFTGMGWAFAGLFLIAATVQLSTTARASRSLRLRDA